MTGNISKSKGVRGYRGAKFTREDFTEADLKALKGDKGDVPSVSFRINEEGNLYYESDGILVDKEYVDSNNLATKEYVLNLVLDIANKVAQSPTIITLYGNKWVQKETYKWYQEIIVPNTTKYSKVNFMLTEEQFNYFKQNGISLYTVNDGGYIVAICEGALPSGDMQMKVTVSEVVIDGE